MRAIIGDIGVRGEADWINPQRAEADPWRPPSRWPHQAKTAYPSLDAALFSARRSKADRARLDMPRANLGSVSESCRHQWESLTPSHTPRLPASPRIGRPQTTGDARIARYGALDFPENPFSGPSGRSH
jgi:hypothetical protein